MVSLLIIEDDNSVRGLFSQFFEREGYRVCCASNGREGLALLRSVGVDLVITDIMMPEMDGLEVVQEIRRLDAELPIIAISGGMRDAVFNFVSAARDFGANAIFEKPVSLHNLLASVKALTGDDRAQRTES
jgi:DNA-binding response OmpR family regulator